MAHSYICIYLHLVFSTKDRRPLIAQSRQRPLWRYFGAILRNHGMKMMAAGGTEDHVHVLVSVSAEAGAAKVVNLLKSNSSRWMRQQDRAFAWQEGYAAFSVSASLLSGVVAYIENQQKHHRKRDFKQEYLALLKKHGIPYDPQWVFG